MCGIYGAISARPDLGPAFERMGAFLRHRGPDDHGVEKLPGALFGHNRLSIIDLSPEAAQPMWDVRRQVCITYNGEIYNYRELRKECAASGQDLATSSDTEVILNQYLLHGEEAFDRLNGIFAFCLYDARSGVFHLARDPLGVKPLYYADGEDGFFFASELKALSRTGILDPEVDPAAFQAYLQLDFVPAPMSILKNVRKLREGFALRIGKEGGRRMRRFTSLPEELPERRAAPGADTAEFGKLLHQAVERQLVADVPVGVFLSGGIDSSLVAKAAQEITGSPIATFSIGFEETSFDESPFFSEAATKLGTDHHVEVLSPGAMLDLLPRISHVACEPLADSSIFPTYLLCKFARNHVKVALSGDGADELFGGYPTYNAADVLSRVALPQSLPGRALARIAHRLLPVSYDNFSFDFRVKKLLEGLHPDPILRNIRWLGSFLPEELPDLMESFDPDAQLRLEEMLHEPAEAAGSTTPLERLLRTDQRFYLQDGVLVKVDRASMASSLEVRVPYLDPEMVAFARSLPSNRKVRGRQFKLIMKDYAAEKLPASILKRPKKGFGTPLGKWFRGELKGQLREILSRRQVESLGFLRPDRVESLLSDHWDRRRDNRKKIFSLLTFMMWHETLRERSLPWSGPGWSGA